MLDKKEFENGKQEFLANITVDKKAYEKVFNQLESEGVDICNITQEDVDQLLYSFHSISPNSLSKYLQFLREIVDFFNPECIKRNRKKNNKSGSDYAVIPTKPMIKYIDRKRLLEKTIIFPHQYEWIKNQITINIDGEEYNIRDKVLFILACEGLTSKEIKHLKKDDIQIIEKDGKYKCKLSLITGREVIVDDTDLAKDIDDCIKEEWYYRTEKSGKEMFVPLRDTPYLIRPVDMNRGKKETVSDPRLILWNVLKKYNMPKVYNKNFNVKYEVDLEHLSIEDLRRSKIMYYLGYYNAKVNEISHLLSKKAENDIQWLKSIAKKIYAENSYRNISK